VKTYVEGNVIADVWLGFTLGINIQGMYVTGQIYNTAGLSYGIIVDGESIVQLQAIGSGYSNVPVVSTVEGQPFQVNGPVQPQETVVGVTGSGFQFTPDVSVFHTGASVPTILASIPTILPPTFGPGTGGNYSQELTIYNQTGYSPITFQDQSVLPGSGLSLAAPTVSVRSGGAISFVWSALDQVWFQVDASPTAAAYSQALSSANVNLETASNNAILTTSILVLTGTLSANITVTFPNLQGAWDVDVSGLTLAGNTLTFASGTATFVAATTVAATNTLWRVVTRGLNTIACQT
jgi:hypothetical protein